MFFSQGNGSGFSRSKLKHFGTTIELTGLGLLLRIRRLRGCRDGAVVRALASHQCGPGSIPRLGRRRMWVECFGSLLYTERFPPGTPVSPLLTNEHL